MIRAAALLLGCAAALACSRSSELSAQQIQLRPQAGLYLPTRISLQGGALHLRQKVGVIAGASMTIRFTDRFDVTTALNYIPGYAILRGAGRRIDIGAGSHVLTASTGARYWLLPAPRPLSWEVHTGFGVVFGGRPAYEDLFESSTVSGLVGTTVRYQLGRLVSLSLRLQERLYRVRFGGSDPGRSRAPLQLSFGLGFPFLELAP